ncbi:MAG TPA: anti-sigma factor [Streptosporangiaceae bacterium]|nr:anti-sigma factor [Streptosporangiaceae bacterium]
MVSARARAPLNCANCARPPPGWRARLRPNRPRTCLSRWSRRGTAILAGAAATGLVAVTAEHHLSTARQSDHAIAQVLNAPDAILLTARVRAGGSATVVMSRRDRALVFTTDGLPPLHSDRCYMLWLMGPAGDRPAGRRASGARPRHDQPGHGDRRDRRGLGGAHRRTRRPNARIRVRADPHAEPRRLTP